MSKLICTNSIDTSSLSDFQYETFNCEKFNNHANKCQSCKQKLVVDGKDAVDDTCQIITILAEGSSIINDVFESYKAAIYQVGGVSIELADKIVEYKHARNDITHKSKWNIDHPKTTDKEAMERIEMADKHLNMDNDLKKGLENVSKYLYKKNV
ncbi:8464_t:CDS:2 [Funneliformis caledonium]|uniref:8464_t:CDS:1 n=1 Tax=Funneliformis caledonium TaxID=1117310 RepID=A0A9N8V2C9_9GLOM|nr:8464_t:CDS:2 [Funneliformis caledonium]